MVTYNNFIVKERFEDFLVDENICLSHAEKSEYIIFILKKKGFTTFEAVDQFSVFFDIDRKQVGFAGLKDEDAVTVQRISMPISYEESILTRIDEFNTHEYSNGKYIKCYFAGYAGNAISVGKLNGNAFCLTLRRLTSEKAQKLAEMRKKIFFFPNYYDQQRFGLPGKTKVTHFIGQSILSGDMESAFLLCKTNGEVKGDIISPEEYFESIDDRKRNFYCNAYASSLFNIELSHKISALTDKRFEYYIAEGIEVRIPYDDLELVDKTVMGQYTDIDRYDLPLSDVPRKSKRENVITVPMRFSDAIPDILHENYYSIVVEFDLPAGCYGTMAMRQLDAYLEII